MKKTLKILGYIFGSIIIAICLSIIIFNASHVYYHVYGPSMSPTLNEGVMSSEEKKDGVFVSRLKRVGRGDIVVVDKNKDSEEKEKFVIKRLIALGGDKIKIARVGEVYRVILIKNGEENEIILDEPYVADLTGNEKTYASFVQMLITTNNLIDDNGFLKLEEDEIFYLGDNRAYSTDCSVYGPKKKDAIIGKVDYIIHDDTHAYVQVLKQMFGG